MPLWQRWAGGFCGLLVFYMFFYILRQTVAQTLKHRRLRTAGASAEASIKALRVEKDKDSGLDKHVVSYDFLPERPDGAKTLRVHARNMEVTKEHYKTLKEGDTVEVIYDSADPAYCRLAAAAEDDVSGVQLCHLISMHIVAILMCLMTAAVVAMSIEGYAPACQPDKPAPKLALGVHFTAVWLSAFWCGCGGGDPHAGRPGTPGTDSYITVEVVAESYGATGRAEP